MPTLNQPATTLTNTITFNPWPPANKIANTIDTDSDHWLFYAAAIVGPTATLLAHRVTRLLTAQPTVTLDLAELAHSLGVDATRARHAIHRLHCYGYLNPTTAETIEIATTIDLEILARKSAHNTTRRFTNTVKP